MLHLVIRPPEQAPAAGATRTGTAGGLAWGGVPKRCSGCFVSLLPRLTCVSPARNPTGTSGPATGGQGQQQGDAAGGGDLANTFNRVGALSPDASCWQNIAL